MVRRKCECITCVERVSSHPCSSDREPFASRHCVKSHDKSNNANPTLRSEEAGRSRQLL